MHVSRVLCREMSVHCVDSFVQKFLNQWFQRISVVSCVDSGLSTSILVSYSIVCFTGEGYGT